MGSLVHDDIIDGDGLRRGRLSVHARYGTADAIIAGDALLLQTFAALGGLADHEVLAAAVLAAIRVIAEAAVDTCRGQTMEAELLGDIRCGLDRYRSMAALKTGALITAACHAGALLGGGSPVHAEALKRFGIHLGLAFQMQDDLLPYTGDNRSTGKPGTSDLANRRPTFPLLVGYEAAGPRERRRFEAALRDDVPAAESYRLVRALLEATGALDRAGQLVAHQVELARGCLADVPGRDGATGLAAIAEFSLARRS